MAHPRTVKGIEGLQKGLRRKSAPPRYCSSALMVLDSECCETRASPPPPDRDLSRCSLLFSCKHSWGHCSISNTVIYTAVADKRVRNIWQKR